ncbi:hypothetical protein C6495_09420 [Candidatus Poribacteria bacterium]|nr:MAG: hypothetical protein C6495_09420 [Candidatus Poribacteria bacterium]
MVSCEVSSADEEIVVRRGKALAYHRDYPDEDASEGDASGWCVIGGGTPSLVSGQRCHRDEMNAERKVYWIRIFFRKVYHDLQWHASEKMLHRAEINCFRLETRQKKGY